MFRDSGPGIESLELVKGGEFFFDISSKYWGYEGRSSVQSSREVFLEEHGSE
jgi:hypothetical protein